MKFLYVLVLGLPVLLTGCAAEVGYSNGGYNSYPGHYSNNSYGHNYDRDAYVRNNSYNRGSSYHPTNRTQSPQQHSRNTSTTTVKTSSQAQHTGNGNQSWNGKNQSH